MSEAPNVYLRLEGIAVHAPESIQTIRLAIYNHAVVPNHCMIESVKAATCCHLLGGGVIGVQMVARIAFEPETRSGQWGLPDRVEVR